MEDEHVQASCSFCRRGEAEVAKLVAGPRVYICDRCAEEALRIIASSGDAQLRPAPARRGRTQLPDGLFWRGVTAGLAIHALVALVAFWR